MRGVLNLLPAAIVALQLTAPSMAPPGTLRATFLGDNPVQGRVDPQTGAVSGPVADLVKELARRLNVPYALVSLPNASAVIDSINAHRADIGFLAYETARAAQVEFSAPYALMQNAYLVRADSAIRTSNDVDRAGITVGAVKGQSQEIYVSANLKQARVDVLPLTPPPAEIEAMLVSGRLDVFAANRARMEAVAARSPKLRVLSDNFLLLGQAIVIEKGDRARLEMLNRFVGDVRGSGFVKASLERGQIAGAEVAPLPAR
jgi:polar amino acid transport system substrate-binding protein